MMRVATLYPDLLGTYGDGGNAVALVERARRRGFAAELLEVRVGDQFVSADVYLLGGGEDGPQRQAADVLRASPFRRAYDEGANVVAVCAGLQILGATFAVEGDDEYEGLGLVDVTTARGTKRSVGELATRVGDEILVGFENHGGVSHLGEGVRPFGTVLRGRGNDGRVDGYLAPHLWATYAHGPVLAMNPWFADEVLASVLARELETLPSVADQLHAQRRRSLGL